MNNKTQTSGDAAQQKNHVLRRFWRSQEREGGVLKHETGIKGFDEMLEGGVPRERATLITAGAGAGKTVLLNEFIYRGAAHFDEPGIFLTFEERPRDIVQNLRNFNWDFDPLLEAEKIVFMDATLPEEGEEIIGTAEWLEPILARLQYLVTKVGAKRLAVDNLGAVFLRYEGEESRRAIRERLFRFADAIKRLGITTILSTEHSESEASLSRFGVAEFVSDGVIEMNIHAGQGKQQRNMFIRKMRGCGYRSGKVAYEISVDGMEVFPKIPIDTSVGETDFSIREGFGIEALDNAMEGGVPQGHIMLVAGNTGTGKSTLALHFTNAGLEKDQGVVWVALEEPVNQVEKTATAHGWNLTAAREKGKLVYVTSPLLDTLADKLLYRIIDAVNANDAKRIVVDSVSSLESATMDKESVREFMLQLAGFAKTQGITVVLNYLSGDTFGASKDQLLGSMMTNDMRLSSIVDGIILLRYVERDREVAKLLNILKLRGSMHVKDIMHYEIDKGGFKLGQRFRG